METKAILEGVETVARIQSVDWTVISLFGSRSDLSARGGDIDLYIKLKTSPKLDMFTFKRDLRILLKEKLGDQKIDLLIDDSVADLGAFGDIVREGKVDLWIKE